jgi:branched-chain amino acid aminotransferase
MQAICNGSLIDEKDAVVPVTRREVFFNFSVYESLKVLGGRPLFAAEHVSRFMESARILGMDHPFTLSEIESYIQSLIEANSAQEATLKIQMIGGKQPHLYLFLSPLPRYQDAWYQDGVSAITYHGERIFPRAKSNCLLLNYIAYREAEKEGALDALLVDREGYVTEGTRSNFYAFQDGTLVTAGEEILFGVTRKLILEAAEAEGIPVRFKKIGLEELLYGSFSEPFISSTSMGAMPLKTINSLETQKGEGERFDKVALLNQAIKEREARELHL